MVYIYGDNYLEKNKNRISYSEDVRNDALDNISKQSAPKGLKGKLALPIWFNLEVLPDILISWVEIGINTLNDVITIEGNLSTIDEIEINCIFLLHRRLKKNRKD